jgi:hypothetical protein
MRFESSLNYTIPYADIACIAPPPTNVILSHSAAIPCYDSISLVNMCTRLKSSKKDIKREVLESTNSPSYLILFNNTVWVALVVEWLVCWPLDPKAAGTKPGQGDGFLREIKISSTSSSRMGSKAGRSHAVRFYGMLKNSWSPSGTNRQNYHFLSPIW